MSHSLHFTQWLFYDKRQMVLLQKWLINMEPNILHFLLSRAKIIAKIHLCKYLQESPRHEEIQKAFNKLTDRYLELSLVYQSVLLSRTKQYFQGQRSLSTSLESFWEIQRSYTQMHTSTGEHINNDQVGKV